MKKLGLTLVVITVFGFFATLFIVLALYLRGTRITPDGQFIETGIVRLNDLDNEAIVLLDDQKITPQSEQIRNLPLGTHTIEVIKDGYNNWEKEIDVSDTRVFNIFPKLYPTKYSAKEIATTATIDSIRNDASSDTLYYGVTKDDVTAGIWEVREDIGFISDSVSNRLIIPFSKSLLEIIEEREYTFDIAPSNREALLILDDTIIIARSNETFEIITDDLGFLPKNISWFGSSERVLVESDGILYDYNVRTSESSVVFFQPNGSYPYSRTSINDIYFWNATKGILQKYESGSVKDIAIDRSLYTEEVLQVESSVENDNIVLLRTSVGIYYFDLASEVSIFLPGFGSIIDISTSGKTVLVKREDELVSLTFKEILRSEKGVENFSLTKIDSEMINPRIIRNDLIIVTELDGGITVADSDGKNPFTINSDNVILEDSFLFTASNKRFIYLEDSSEDESSLQVITLNE